MLELDADTRPNRYDERRIAGVDEAGRGPLAGPVIAAAVILDPTRPVAGLRDSKLLSARQRLRLARQIKLRARAFALGIASVEEIDAMNILQASLIAMERAVLRLRLEPSLLRIDGNRAPRFEGRRASFGIETVVGGDRSIAAISAASILAKVCRDHLLLREHRRFPMYAFDRNKGYPTAEHLTALAAHGPSPIHRRSFAPVRETLAGTAP